MRESLRRQLNSFIRCYHVDRADGVPGPTCLDSLDAHVMMALRVAKRLEWLDLYRCGTTVTRPILVSLFIETLTREINDLEGCTVIDQELSHS